MPPDDLVEKITRTELQQFDGGAKNQNQACPRGLEQSDAIFQGRQGQLNPLGMQDMHGRRLERQYYRWPVHSARLIHSFRDQGLMATMHAVEITNGECATKPGGGQLLAPVDEKMRHAPRESPNRLARRAREF